jgi:peptidoglycan/xylan/chitin deacetylase (PgdA/CDA1 family)
VSGVLRRLIVGLDLVTPIRRVFGGVGAILMMHRVAGGHWMAEPDSALLPSMLSKMIRSLRHAGYEIVSLDEGLRRLTVGGPRFACLTFDDGYRDNHDFVWPVLRREGAPATIYLTTGFIDGSHTPWRGLLSCMIETHNSLNIDGERLATRHYREKDAAYALLHARMAAMSETAQRDALTRWVEGQGATVATVRRSLFLDWDTIRAMASDGLVCFGAHSVSHPHLSELPQDLAAWEITHSGRRIAQELGTSPRHFAFPFGLRGDSGPREVRMVAEAGYASAVHASGGPLATGLDPMSLPRVPFGGGDDTVDLAIRLTGLGPVLRRLFVSRNAQPLHESAL